jgi:hypothetical protein
MDFAKAFSFVFDDQDWITKILIGGLIFLIPVIGSLIVLGYSLAVTRNVIRRQEPTLPEWSDFGQMLIDGLFGLIIGLVYSLPIIIIVCVAMIPGMAVGVVSEDAGGALAGLGSCCAAVFSVVYGLAMVWFFIPVAMARYADTGDMMSALRFREIWDISRANYMVFLMALLIYFAAGLVASAGSIACIVGALFTSFYSYCVIGHAYGQAYLIASEEVV